MAKTKKTATEKDPEPTTVAEVEAEVKAEAEPTPVVEAEIAPAAKVEAAEPVAADVEAVDAPNTPPWEQKHRKTPTKKYRVELHGGRANYPADTLNAVDSGEAIGFFIQKHGVRGAANYRRRVTLVDDNGE